jgi:hypothetical protein
MFMSAHEIDAEYQPADEDRTVRMPGPEKMGAYQRGEIDRSELYAGQRETTEHLWERKRAEWGPYAVGKVVHPISLTESIGTEGKPKIAGGHHRIAKKLEEDPNELMPVLHYTDTEAAQQDRRYT